MVQCDFKIELYDCKIAMSSSLSFASIIGPGIDDFRSDAPRSGQLVMASIVSLGDFLREEVSRLKISNRALAMGAGVSEFAIRNLLQHGLDPRAKDPDPRTLKAVADFLHLDIHKLFRLAGYLPPSEDAPHLRTEIFADVFENLPEQKQEALLKLAEAMADTPSEKELIRTATTKRSRALEGFDLDSPYLIRSIANAILRSSQAEVAGELDSPSAIDSNLVVANGLKWGTLPESAQQRALGLARAKLNLNYDPSMVERIWRE
jgi:hypothetical protein